MNEKKIKELVDGICISDEDRDRISDGYIYKWEQAVKRNVLIKKSIKIFVCCILAIILILNLSIVDQEKTFGITVHAAMGDGTVSPVLLDNRKEVLLQLQDTPVGKGYIFEIALPDKYSFESISIDETQPLFTVYQDKDHVYWIPEIQIAGNIYTDNSEMLETQLFHTEADSCKFEIAIYNPNHDLYKKLRIEFRIEGNQCKVKLF